MLSRMIFFLNGVKCLYATLHNAFPTVKVKDGGSDLWLAGLLCVFTRTCIRRRVRMCQRSLFTPSFFASVQAVYIGPSGAGDSFFRRRRDKTAGLRVTNLASFPPWLRALVRPSHVDLIRAGESELRQSLEPSSLPIRFLVHCFRRSISTSTDWSNSCSQCSQTGLFQNPYPFMEYILYNYMYLSNCWCW